MIEIAPMPAGDGTAGRDVRPRLTERHVLALGLGVSGAFMLAAVVVAAASVASGTVSWGAIHLAMAGAATTAIGAFMPHFAITLAGTRPEPAVQRMIGLGLLAGGATLAVLGMTVIGGAWAAVGALAMIGGLGFTAWQTVAPLRSPLSRRHPIVTVCYLVALLQLAIGVAIGGLAGAGVDVVIGAWATIRPAHAWLTVIGAVSLTIFGTLVYLAPTILGARIRPGLALATATTGLVLGPPTAAIGFVTGAPAVVIAGAVVTLIGSVGQVGYVADVARRRGPYTSEHDWRRVAAWHVLAGPAWFAVAVGVATVELASGRPIQGWSIGPLAVPLIAGWTLQELVGSWTHLAPSVSPGSPDVHAAQRQLLAIGSRLRPMTWNLGVAALWVGLAFGAPVLVAAGGIAVGATAVASVVVLLRALTIRSAPTAEGLHHDAGRDVDPLDSM